MLTISNPTISKTVVNTGERFIVSVEVTSKMTWAELKKAKWSDIKKYTWEQIKGVVK